MSLNDAIRRLGEEYGFIPMPRDRRREDAPLVGSAILNGLSSRAVSEAMGGYDTGLRLQAASARLGQSAVANAE